MGLARVFTNLGNLIIRKIGDTGGPPSDRVSSELDNIIAWAKDAKRIVARAINTPGTVGAGVTSLHSIVIPANTLVTDGDILFIKHAGQCAANDNDKIITYQVGGNNIFGIVAVVDIDGGAWEIVGDVYRISATSVRVSARLTAAFSFVINSAGTTNTGTLTELCTSADFAVANLNSNSLTLLVQGQGTANNDVTQNKSLVELYQQ